MKTRSCRFPPEGLPVRPVAPFGLAQYCGTRCGRGCHAGTESVEDAVEIGAEKRRADDDAHCDQRGDQTVLDGRCAVFVTKEGLNKLNEFHGDYLLLGG